MQCLDPNDLMMISIAQDNDSVLNSTAGRKRLAKAGIDEPVSVGIKIADKLRRLRHMEPAENLETFVNKRFGRTSGGDATAEIRS